ncbi:MAG: LEPR-XLL domain-containing protein, partial [Gammaproteobacteria bacterium]|nr:LEPR-XLL domain-containing protein [Gammaproteobacteria bacterium]
MSRKRPSKAIVPAALETLEQRILLAADLGVLDTSGAEEPLAAHVETTPTTTATESAAPTPEPRTPDPLTVHSATGTVQTLAADAASDLQLGTTQRLEGSGVLSGALVNSGVIAPGASPGILTVDQFSQNASGRLLVELGGTNPGATEANPNDGYDQVISTAGVALAGVLELDYLEGFRPTAGQVFDVLKWSTTRSGEFSAFRGLYAGGGIYLKPEYRANSLSLVATAIPGLDQITLPAEAEAAFDQVLSAWLTGQVDVSVSINAALELPGVTVSGAWTVSTVAGTAGVTHLKWTAADVRADWSLPGFSGGIANLTGFAQFGGNTVFDLAGDGFVAVAGHQQLSGRFSIAYDATAASLTATATGVAVRLGDPNGGGSIGFTNGALAFRSAGADYRLAASGAASVQGLAGLGFTGNLAFVADPAAGLTGFTASDASLSIANLGS